MSAVEIVAAMSDTQVGEVRRLFQEYWDSFGFTACFQDFGRELAELPGKYVPPRGRLGLALVEGRPAGCVALRPIDEARCEAKRLYVKPEARGLGLGTTLLNWVVAEARAAGYSELLGDTMPVMQEALAMYYRFGFERTGPYTAGATEGAIYLRLKL
jgi:putative acetyltransferase